MSDELIAIMLVIVGIAVADFVIITHYIKKVMDLMVELTDVMKKVLKNGE
jgi:hypothetical protein